MSNYFINHIIDTSLICKNYKIDANIMKLLNFLYLKIFLIEARLSLVYFLCIKKTSHEIYNYSISLTEEK